MVSERFVKEQRVRWTDDGAHLLSQVRTRELNGDLAEAFRHWYPCFWYPCFRSDDAADRGAVMSLTPRILVFSSGGSIRTGTPHVAGEVRCQHVVSRADRALPGMFPWLRRAPRTRSKLSSIRAETRCHHLPSVHAFVAPWT